ncbi:DUF805 domain-containing protein [Pseudooceanicola sp. LIPI14-2-Ac024]|uniref:DUF805 domain-containing protein n=1 Tax=Pseudooceanicola sp. LIPI14-2-Ac024 TaxID=3344875 RepID=UPI0035D0B450
MDFVTAVKMVLGKYATFSGRAKRPEFWWFVLFVILAGLVVGILDAMLFGASDAASAAAGYSVQSEPLSALFALAVFLPYLAVAVRRLHDIDKSGWWVLIGLIPLVGWIVLLIFYVRRGTEGDNRFGPEPAA